MAKTNKANKDPRKDKSEKSPRRFFWKGVALIALVVFCIIVVVSIVRFNHSRPHYIPAEQSQIDMAKAAISADLSSSGDNISNYDVQIGGDMRKFPRESMEKRIIQASLGSGNKRHLYLIDADTGKIVMHSETTVYDWMQNLSINPPPSQEHRGFFPFFWHSPWEDKRQDGKINH